MSATHYDRMAIALHWAMALLIGLNLGLGFWMHEAIDVARTQASAVRVYQWHKSIGLVLLLLAVFRLAWRLASPRVELPARRWQRFLAGTTHGLLYGLMVLLPLSGWLMVSTQWRGGGPLTLPTQWFGLIEVPHLMGLGSWPEPLREQAWRLARSAHEISAWVMLGLLIGHTTAALLHARRVTGFGVDRPGEGAQLGFRMRWQAAGALRVSGARLFAWLILFFALTAWAVSGPRDPAENDDAPTSTLDWPAPQAAGLPLWTLDRQQSAIRFSGAVNGESFDGRFEQWDLRIGLDTTQPESAYLHARILTGSATTGVPLHDRTLEETEWFDVQRHPYASFQLTSMTAMTDEPGRYQLQGQLSVKNETLPISSLMMSVSNKQMRIEGRVRLDRTELNLGMSSDPEGEYVSRTIAVDVLVQAHQASGP